MSPPLEPQRPYSRITGFDDELYVLDAEGFVWVNQRPYLEPRRYWTLLCPVFGGSAPTVLAPARDLYMHIDPGEEGPPRGKLRILDACNTIWQLRRLLAANDAFVWDEVTL